MKGPVVENVVLTVHLILAVLLIGLVLLQRSEGGGLGIGGGGGGVMTGRQAANAMTRLTWMLAAGFLVTSLSLTVIAARNSSNGSIADQLDLGGAPTQSLPGIGEYAPPPGASTTAPAPAPAAGSPITPPGATTPATEAPAAEAPAAATPAPAPAAEAPAEAATPEPAPATPATPGTTN